MRLGLAALLAAIATGACAAEFRDGHQVEGVWVSNASWSVEECEPRDFCDRLVEVAAAQVKARVPSADIRGVTFHHMAHERSDGSVVTVTHQTYYIVFHLADGSERVEHFGCDMHGGLMGGIGTPVYSQFCPAVMSGGST
jgi:hypothetical protein